MASPSQNNPHVDIEITLDPATHSFSNESPPTVTLRVTSRAEHPITIFTWDRPLHPKGALTSNGFVITDKAAQQPVKTTHIMVQRGAIKRTRGRPDEEYFLTLYPKQAVELSTGFGRGGGGVKPQPRVVVERGRELDKDGNERNIRRSVNATGVDGLEPGHQYLVGLNMDTLAGCWWAPVARDEILTDDDGEGSYVQEYPWETENPLSFNVSEATLSVVD
jgi:hypothetical protein